MVKKSISQLKKIAWKLFSLYIRNKYADWKGNVYCVTCQTMKPVKEMQAGHFIGGRRNSVLFDEKNVHPQCYVCNIMKHGNQLAYYRFMVKTYGEDEVKRLEKLDRIDRQWKPGELEALIEKYKKLISELPTE